MTATLRLELSGTPRPMIKLPPPVISITTIEDGGLLKLATPDGAVQYGFRVRFDGDALELTQETDDHGYRLPFRSWIGDPEPRTLRLARGEPFTTAYNVPGGGPIWTITLTEMSS